MKPLPKSFYARDTALIARELLGKVLVHRTRAVILTGRIVETEAYYGENDPASRAYTGKKIYNKLMWSSPGLAFIYMVHANWLFNIVSKKPGKVGAILIRALEPIEGIKQMLKNRKVKNHRIAKLRELTSGPGKLTQAFGITNSHQGLKVYGPNPIQILDGTREKFKIARSHRIGVRRDLKRKLRFYIKGNKFVSK